MPKAVGSGVQELEGAEVRFGDVNNVRSLADTAFNDPVDVVVSCLASRTGGKVGMLRPRICKVLHWLLMQLQGADLRSAAHPNHVLQAQAVHAKLLLDDEMRHFCVTVLGVVSQQPKPVPRLKNSCLFSLLRLQHVSRRRKTHGTSTTRRR